MSTFLTPSLPDYESYDYRTEWSKRRLEDMAEKKVLNSLLPDGGTLLELGGGFGRLTEGLSRRFCPSVMVDGSSLNTKLARKIAPAAETVRAELAHLPFRDGTFDRLVMVRVVHHLPQPQFVLGEISRVIRGRGVAVISVPNRRASKDGQLGNTMVGRGTQGHEIYAAPVGYYTSALPLSEIRGVGLFDNALGKALRWVPSLHLLDVATSRLWRVKKTLFLKFVFDS